jgi:cobalt-zinc-cadmium efflux system protein
MWRSPHDSHHHLGKKTALKGAILLSLMAFVLQLVGTWYTGSLALLGDSMHLLTDLVSLAMSLAAVILAALPTTNHRSFGFYRLEVLASFVNGILLLVVSLGLAREAILRLWVPEPVKTGPLLVVAALGLLFNLASAWLLYRASKETGEHHAHSHEHDHQHLHSDRNMQSALLHVCSDALGSVAVIVAAVLMQLTNVLWLDPAVGLLLALWILRWAWKVILESAHVLLESTPRHVKPEVVVSGMSALDSRVEGVYDLHVWELTSRMYAATAEVKVRDMDLLQAEALRQRIHELLREQFGIAHVVLAIRPA